MVFPGGSVVKNLLASAEEGGLIPGQGKSLEQDIATHSSSFAWKIPWIEESGGLQSVASQRSNTTEQLSIYVPAKYLTNLYSEFRGLEKVWNSFTENWIKQKLLFTAHIIQEAGQSPLSESSEGESEMEHLTQQPTMIFFVHIFHLPSVLFISVILIYFQDPLINQDTK